MLDDTNKQYRLLQDEIMSSEHFEFFKRHVTQNYALHWHNYIEIELITGGHGSQTLNDTPLSLQQGALSILRLTDYHEIRPEPYLDMYNLSFEAQLLSDEILDVLTLTKENMFFMLSEQEFEIIQHFCELCYEERNTPQPNLQYIKNLLECICIRLFRLRKLEKIDKRTSDTAIHRTLVYMHTHFRENPSLTTLSQISHYSLNHFSTIFHKTIGMTYHDYLNQLKVKYAKQLLVSTNLKSIDICFQCGFNSFNSFLRTFKTLTGLTPIEYRKRKKDKESKKRTQ